MSIRELRLKLGWTQAELANEAGVTVQTINRAENGHPINKSTARLISTILKTQTGSMPIIVVRSTGRKEQ